ncbi:MAG TPA: family 78 glycoside hydrolase catalytic domain, partial [Bryobacteraceae bacterium]|nr:family 78 glycoside hydrolase catalytic domain [Bryobacteraceae bacterium]
MTTASAILPRTVALAALIFSAAAGAPLAPYALECEARANPIGVDAARPRLSWKLRAAGQGERQSAYQVLVASTREELAADRGDLWDSGRVASARSAWIPYQGVALRSFQRVWWKVQVWNAAGAASGWSDAAEWTAGVLDPGQWHGGWIAGTDAALKAGPLPIFRKEITIERPLARALVLVAAPGFYELRINGKRVGDHELAPAWTNFRQTTLYEMFDVTPLLKNGRNALGALLGNGFYNVAGGRYAKFTGSFGTPRLYLMLHLEYAGGGSADIATDGSWRVHAGPVTFTCMYGGEDFDARQEPQGWDRPGFDDSSWPHAGSVEPAGPLHAQASPPVRVQQRFSPVRVSEPKPGVFVYDLGQNFAGRPRLIVSGAAGAAVRMTPGELLDDAGLVNQHSSGSPTYFTYTLAGAG